MKRYTRAVWTTMLHHELVVYLHNNLTFLAFATEDGQAIFTLNVVIRQSTTTLIKITGHHVFFPFTKLSEIPQCSSWHSNISQEETNESPKTRQIPQYRASKTMTPKNLYRQGIDLAADQKTFLNKKALILNNVINFQERKTMSPKRNGQGAF